MTRSGVGGGVGIWASATPAASESAAHSAMTGLRTGDSFDSAGPGAGAVRLAHFAFAPGNGDQSWTKNPRFVFRPSLPAATISLSSGAGRYFGSLKSA